MEMERFSGSGLVEGLYWRWVEAHPEALEARNLWRLFAPDCRDSWEPAVARAAAGWVEANTSESDWKALYVNLGAADRLGDDESLEGFKERILAAFESSWTEWFLDLLDRFGFEWFDLSDGLADLGGGDYLVVLEVGAALRFPPSFPLPLRDFEAEEDDFEVNGLDLRDICPETGMYRFRGNEDTGEWMYCLYTTMEVCE
jgi:hypothetical protein